MWSWQGKISVRNRQEDVYRKGIQRGLYGRGLCRYMKKSMKDIVSIEFKCWDRVVSWKNSMDFPGWATLRRPLVGGLINPEVNNLSTGKDLNILHVLLSATMLTLA